MNRTTAFCLTAACFMSAGPAVQASQISSSHYNWSYQFVSNGHPVNVITSNNAKGVVILPSTGSGSLHTAEGATTNISTKIWSFSNASAGNPQSVNLPFAINLKITDHASGLSAYVSFTGMLQGNIWNNGSNLVANFASTSASVDINHHLYTVTSQSFTPPQGDGHAGSFKFDVKTQHNPEPSTFVLAAIGVPFFGLHLRRRRRRG